MPYPGEIRFREELGRSKKKCLNKIRCRDLKSLLKGFEKEKECSGPRQHFQRECRCSRELREERLLCLSFVKERREHRERKHFRGGTAPKKTCGFFWG